MRACSAARRMPSGVSGRRHRSHNFLYILWVLRPAHYAVGFLLFRFAGCCMLYEPSVRRLASRYMSTRKTLIYLSFLLSFFCPHRYLTNLTNVDSTIVEATETTVALEHDELRTMQSLSGHFLRKIMRSRATHASRRNEPMPVAELHARCRSMDVPNYHPQHEHAERRPRATANAKWGCWRAQSPQQRARARPSGPP